MHRAGREDLLQKRRIAHERLTIGDQHIWLRDQAPLHAGNAQLPCGFAFGQLVEMLNKRVFFWPGTTKGPIGYGLRHFSRYQREKPVLLRVDFAALIAKNSRAVPLFCRYNSGAPRCSYGKKSPRDKSTFVPAEQFHGSPSVVVEVTFSSDVVLPEDVRFAYDPSGPWRSMLLPGKD